MGTEKVWDGTLSTQDFYIAAKALCEKWKEINSSFPNGRGFLVNGKRVTCLLRMFAIFARMRNLVTSKVSLRKKSHSIVATLVHRPNEETHIYNFHTVYSFSYRVPVLYFCGHRCDGQPLNSDDIHKDLPSYSQSLLKESKWTFMTQEEHPFLNSPWYTLHPCGISDWMKLMLGDIQHKELVVVQYLPSWLSVVAQPVGFRVPLNMHSKAVRNSFLPMMVRHFFCTLQIWGPAQVSGELLLMHRGQSFSLQSDLLKDFIHCRQLLAFRDSYEILYLVTQCEGEGADNLHP